MIETTVLRAGRDETRQLAGDLHPALKRLFADLQRRELSWTLLRLPSRPAAPSGDVDILVAPAQAQELRETAAEHGFVAVPGWDSGGNLLLLRYDRESGCWLLLDVTTEITFRRPRGFRLQGAAEDVLARRQVHDGVALPAADDQFWLMLLHCLLDKRSLPEAYRPVLHDLAPASPRSPLADAVFRADVSTHTRAPDSRRDADIPAWLLAAVLADNWNALIDVGRRLEAMLQRNMTAYERLGPVVARLVRVSKKPLLVRRRRGVSIALLGPNGVGKSTACVGLQQSFPFDSRVLYMGLWKGVDEQRAAVFRGLEVIVRPLRIWARYASAQYHQLRGRLVIFDRFVYEAVLPSSPPLLTAKRIYSWWLAHLIPAPSAVAVLDVPGVLAYRRKQENPPEELEVERRVYAELQSRRRVELVDATADAARVRAELAAIVWRQLTARWQT